MHQRGDTAPSAMHQRGKRTAFAASEAIPHYLLRKASTRHEASTSEVAAIDLQAINWKISGDALAIYWLSKKV